MASDIMSYENPSSKDKRTKKCTKCGEVKPFDEFYKQKAGRYGLKSHCKTCCNRGAYSPRRKENQRKYRMKHRFTAWANQTLKSHHYKGFVVLINRDELADIARSTTQCQLCNCELDWTTDENRYKKMDIPTLDRKYNGNRLSINNTWIICKRCNMIKQNLPLPEFVNYCTMIVNKFGGE